MTRYRSKSETSTTCISVHRSSDDDDGMPPSWKYESITTGSSGSFKEITDESHSSYSRRRGNGEVILGTLSLGTWMREYQSMSLDLTGEGGYHAYWQGDLASLVEGLGVIAPLPSYPDLQSIALINAYAKIKGNVVVTGEIAADFGKVISGLKSPFRGVRKLLAKAAKSAKKHYRKTAESVTRANASAWLEYSYGIRPLMLDAGTVVENTQSFAERRGRKRLVVRSGKSWSGTSQNNFSDVAIPAFPWLVSGSSSLSREVKVGAGVIYDVRVMTSGERMSQDYQLGVDAFAPTLWETIPYSFVADWFVNIGPWLEAWNLPPSVSVLGNWVTTVDKLTQELISSRLTEGPVVGSFGGSTIHNCSVIRNVNQPLPTTPVVLGTPLRITQAVSGVALSLDPILDLLRKLKH